MTGRITLLQGDCRDLMPQDGTLDMILADPPYGDTALRWDNRVAGWHDVAAAALKPTGSMWVFGSFRYLMADWANFIAAGFVHVQEVIWEKHNGSSFLNDRFRRVHEIAVQFRLASSPWADIYNDVQKTNDAVKRQIRAKARPPHLGQIDRVPYVSEDGGPRLMRSVLHIRSAHGSAIHPTEKPVPLLEILIKTSCPRGGLVGDFFAGSGACGEACRLSDRRYIGCEIDDEYFPKASARLANLERSLVLVRP